MILNKIAKSINGLIASKSKYVLYSKFSSQPNLAGVYPPIITPFTAHEEIDYDNLQQNIVKMNDVNFRGLVVQGSNGEFVMMTEQERVEIVKFCRSHLAPDKLLIAGSGCESTRATINMTQKMADVGADVAMVVTPSYFKGKMTNAALVHHYTKIADESPIPVLLYSVPANTGVDLPASIAIDLASHPKIVGIKDSAGNVVKLSQILHKTDRQQFQILAGSAGFFVPGLTIGCIGGIFALANILGPQLCLLHQLFLEGKLEEAVKLQLKLVEPNIAVTQQFGVAGLKTAMSWFGYHGGYTRAPLLPLDQSETDLLRNKLREFLP